MFPGSITYTKHILLTATKCNKLYIQFTCHFSPVCNTNLAPNTPGFVSVSWWWCTCAPGPPAWAACSGTENPRTSSTARSPWQHCGHSKAGVSQQPTRHQQKQRNQPPLLVNQILGNIDLPQSQLVVIFVIQNVHQVRVKRMNILEQKHNVKSHIFLL